MGEGRLQPPSSSAKSGGKGMESPHAICPACDRNTLATIGMCPTMHSPNTIPKAIMSTTCRPNRQRAFTRPAGGFSAFSLAHCGGIMGNVR